MEEDKRYKEAKKKVEDIKGFYIHLFIYIVVNIGLFVINIISTPDSYWFYWPLLGWGIGIAMHGVSVFVSYGIFGKEWEEKQIKKYMDKENK